MAQREHGQLPSRVRLNDMSGLGLVTDGLDVVTIRADDEGCVVVCVVLRAQPRWPVVLAPRGKRRAVEGLDLLPSPSSEGQMQVRRLRFDSPNAQRRLAVRTAKFDTEGPLQSNDHAEWFERPGEECLALCIVADTEYDMVKHAIPQLLGLPRPGVRAKRAESASRHVFDVCRKADPDVHALLVDRERRLREPWFRERTNRDGDHSRHFIEGVEHR